MPARRAISFNHLVGAGEQRRRDSEAERYARKCRGGALARGSRHHSDAPCPLGQEP
jgi:hypothetical protein